jgi:hypothetical protein
MEKNTWQFIRTIRLILDVKRYEYRISFHFGFLNRVRYRCWNISRIDNSKENSKKVLDEHIHYK